MDELAGAVDDLDLVRLQVADEVPAEGVAVRGVLASRSWARFSPTTSTPASTSTAMSSSDTYFVAATTVTPAPDLGASAARTAPGRRRPPPAYLTARGPAWVDDQSSRGGVGTFSDGCSATATAPPGRTGAESILSGPSSPGRSAATGGGTSTSSSPPAPPGSATVLGHAQHLGRPLRHGTALDFGCGVGRLTHALAPHFERTYGVDVSSTMIEQAQAARRAPRPVGGRVRRERPRGSVAVRVGLDRPASVLPRPPARPRPGIDRGLPPGVRPGAEPGRRRRRPAADVHPGRRAGPVAPAHARDALPADCRREPERALPLAQLAAGDADVSAPVRADGRGARVRRRPGARRARGHRRGRHREPRVLRGAPDG